MAKNGVKRPRLRQLTDRLLVSYVVLYISIKSEISVKGRHDYEKREREAENAPVKTLKNACCGCDSNKPLFKTATQLRLTAREKWESLCFSL